ncbi:hypothetical protein PG997_006370 [Apiospora hydei]|uniref:Protein kinase domain-containing protein n=1 Tax=Apiospora hydei TaxID=1337664 RepID=A0ABR1WRT0_9PEZI
MFGDRLGQRGRYEVANKLGWGYRSTVWLCKDSEIDSWRAVKVLQAEDSTDDNTELKIFKLLENIDRDELELNHIGLPESYFWQDGPNGKHLCFVSKLVASMLSIPPSGYGLHSPTLLTDLCFQLALAVKYLHDKGICHGDIRIENIAMRLDDSVEKLSQHELEQHIGGALEFSEVERLSGRPAYPHAPDYTMHSAPTLQLESHFRTGKLVLIDFGLSYETSKLPPEQMSYRSNAAPELLFRRSPRGPATDLWALACVMLQLRTSWPLVRENAGWRWVLEDMEWRWGPLPEIYKEDVSDKLKLHDSYSVDANRKTHWRPGDPLSIPITLDIYQKTKDDWSHRMYTIQGYLSRAEQMFKHHLKEGREFTFYDGSSDYYSSDDDNGPVKKKRKTSRSSASPAGEEATESSRVAEPTKSLNGAFISPVAAKTAGLSESEGHEINNDLQRAIEKGLPYKKGNFPDSSNPCICDWDRDRGRRIGIGEACKAEQHWKGDPEQLVVWQMSKNERRVFGDLLEGIFKYDPKERLAADQVINHRWFKGRREALKE